MFKKLINAFLLVNGVSSLDEDKAPDKWAERREKYGKGDASIEHAESMTEDQSPAEPENSA